MTRRERHERIINGFDDHRFRWYRDELIQCMGLAAFTDEAIERFASSLVSAHRRQQAMNKRNREIIRARAAGAS